jgi:hypothetical protein
VFGLSISSSTSQGPAPAAAPASSSVPLGRSRRAQIDAMDVGVEVQGAAAGVAQWFSAVSRLHTATWRLVGVNGQRAQGLA